MPDHAPDLFDPLPLGPLTLPNRVVMAPMTRTRAADDGTPTPLMVEYYRQRASAGLVVTECTEVSPQGHGIVRAPGVHRPEHVAGWRAVTDAVHGAGGRVFLQVWHCGRVSHPDLRGGEPPVAPSAVAAEGQIYTPSGPQPFPTPRPLALAEIPAVVESFAAAARRAREAGFDGVELHGAFGYLPDQFLQSGSNRRTDAYGGSVSRRARFMLEVAEAITGAWAPDRVGVKLSPSNRYYGTYDDDPAETFAYAARELDALGVAYLHVMEPSEADLAHRRPVQLRHPTAALRPHAPSAAMISNGGYTRETARQTLADGTADAVSFGTAYVANPDLVRRLRTGAPLGMPDPSTFYGEGPGGYTDYPALDGPDPDVPAARAQTPDPAP